ncbi:DUF484 family protein [Marinobacterium arenosum]|uniref:DUF484 family protein n=1 Tax=Marinobacterium arenosum TaxID=2862496 RepID=UPI001C96F249|nr:DUF484 family protein [Marinobacterium arenosum]MBY4676427.1 DUF484 family protein [Marinobacterium arenosum]
MSDLISQLDEQQVADFLAAHPDFFSRHIKLLEKLYVPHQTGAAVSLVERQTSVLREKTQRLNAHLSDLVDIARHNDMQFEKTKRMVLNLLEAETLDDVAVAVEESLCQDFHGDSTALLLFSEKVLDTNNLRVMPREQAAPVDLLVESNLASCGQLSDEQYRFLFQQDAERIGSAAVVPLVKGQTIGLLAIGSYDPDYFQSSQGTLYLSYVGEVLSRVLYRILQRG